MFLLNDMYVALTWTWPEFTDEDCFWFFALTFSDCVVASFADHLPLLNPFVAADRTLPHQQPTQTQAHTQLLEMYSLNDSQKLKFTLSTVTLGAQTFL